MPGWNAWDWRNRADDKVETLSKGMSQKVQFIAAVIPEPKLLILDEPFTGLDPVSADSIRGAILEMRRRGCTIILSTHDMGVAESLCDSIFMIFRGRKVLDGTLGLHPNELWQRHHPRRGSGRRSMLGGLPGIERIKDLGQVQELRMAPGCDPQEVLRTLVARTQITEFAVIEPSLHDIFVRIAGPAAGGGGRCVESCCWPSATTCKPCQQAYLVGLIFFPLLFGGGFLFLPLANRGNAENPRIAVIDHTGVSAAAVIQAAEEANRRAMSSCDPSGARRMPRYTFEEVKPEAGPGRSALVSLRSNSSKASCSSSWISRPTPFVRPATPSRSRSATTPIPADWWIKWASGCLPPSTKVCAAYVWRNWAWTRRACQASWAMSQWCP